MSDDRRTVQVKGETLVLRFGSSLHWLYGWYDTVEDWLLNDNGVDDCTWLAFLPTKEMEEAVMALSVYYRLPMDMILETLKEAETLYDEFIKTRDSRKGDELSEVISILYGRLASAILVIAENETPDEAEPVEEEGGKKDSPKTQEEAEDAIKAFYRAKLRAKEKMPSQAETAIELGVHVNTLRNYGFKKTKLLDLWYRVSEEQDRF